MRKCLKQLPFRSQFGRQSTFRADLIRRRFSAQASSFAISTTCTCRPVLRSFSRSARYDGSVRTQRTYAHEGAGNGCGGNNAEDAAAAEAEKPQQSPEEWIGKLEKYLPRHLSQSTELESRTATPGDRAFEDLLRIFRVARTLSNVEVLTYMTLAQRRYKAVVHLAETLLKAVAVGANEPFTDELPSNIIWPNGSFAKRRGGSIELERTLHVNRRPFGPPLHSFDNSSIKEEHEAAMKIVWNLLADLVIASTKRPSDEAKQIMSTVHQILAHVHNLGLVPASIYNYSLPQETSTLQQPPILHLLNSRILSTMSDAVWDAYQDQVSSQSAGGHNRHWSLYRERPGGRLRSKVRELGPEIWLEFILWCCIEAGLAPTASQIIKSLHAETEDPWHAVHWGKASVPSTDQDRANYREGRLFSPAATPGGRIRAEENTPKFISAEVVIATVDCLINNMLPSTTRGGSDIAKVQSEIQALILFLEPHELNPVYLDYIAVRLLQTEYLYDLDPANSLQNLVSTIAHSRDFDPMEEQDRHRSGLAFDFVLDRSELRAGMLHQALQACIEANLVKKAVDTFTNIQKMVDGSKLQAIGEFLALPLQPQDGFFTSRLGKEQKEFLNSHGQLPTYKLSPLLDMVTNAKLFGLGDWLVFSEEVDGPVLPSSAWGQPSIAAALTRYATAKDDRYLADRVMDMCNQSDRMLTVNTLRAFVTYHINACDWDWAVNGLQSLRISEGGGYSPRIVANLAATILRLEMDPQRMLQDETESHLIEAMLMLRNILSGLYDSSPATFRIDQKKAFKQQVAYLLRLLENVSESRLAAVASTFRPKFPVSNEPNLAGDTFNVLFAAVVEMQGVVEGRNIWHLFCQDPRNHGAVKGSKFHDDEILVDEHMPGNDGEDFDWQQTDKPLGGDHAEPFKDDGNVLSLNTSSTDAPSEGPSPISDKEVCRQGPRIPVAYPASITLDAGLPQDKYGFASSQSSDIPKQQSADFDTPVEAPHEQLDDGPAELTPIVIPNMRTLQILVRAALQQIKARQYRKRRYDDLNSLLSWAKQFYGAFHLAPEDIKTEFLAKSSIPKTLSKASRAEGTSRHARLIRSKTRERSKPDVRGQFNRGALSTRMPGAPRPEQLAAQIHGASKMEDGNDGVKKDERSSIPIEGGPTVAPVAPRVKIRKFGSTYSEA